MAESMNDESTNDGTEIDNATKGATRQPRAVQVRVPAGDFVLVKIGPMTIKLNITDAFATARAILDQLAARERGSHGE